MAERLAYLEAVVGADITDFRRGMAQIRNDVGILSSTIGGISGAARSMTYAFTVPMVALGTYAVNAASGFDAAMRNINSIVGMNETDLAALSATAFDFAKTTRAGVTPAVEALYEVFSAGITDQGRALAVWETSNRVAEASVGDLTATTNAITATMSAFNLETDQATRVGNVWTRMVQLGVGSLDDFLSNSQKVLPLSSALNISLEDMGATLAFLSQGGGGAAKAETAYAMMLSNLLKPTKAMEEALTGLGVNSGEALIEKFGSVGEAVMALKRETGDVDFSKLFSKTGLEAALRITDNFDAMSAAAADFNKNLDTATMDAWNQQSKSFAMQWDLMLTALQGVAIVIGQQIIPLISPLVTGFTSLLTQISETNPEIVQMGVVFVGLVAAAAPVIWLLTSMLTPIGLIVGGLGALAVAFATNFGGIRDTVTQAIPDILGDLAPLKEAVDTFLGTLFPTQNNFDVKTGASTPLVVDLADHITVTEPKSLWQIYEENGYAEKFSWPAFMEEAKKGGWTGGAINIDDEITIEGGVGLGQKTAQDFTTGFNSSMGAGFGDGMSGVSEQTKAGGAGAGSIFDRLAEAATAAWPKLKIALDEMWTNFTTWVNDTAIPAVDSAGSDILNHIAGWFSTTSSDFSGNSGAYTAMTGLMAGVPAAVNDLSTSFPELTSALSNLFTSIGNWIEAEGLPTIARAAGNLVGQLAVGMGKLLGGVWDAIRPGGGVQSGAGAATNVVKTTVVDPFSSGFQDALGENDIQGGIDGFVSGIAGLLVTAFGVATFGQMLAGKGLMSAIWGSINFVIGGGGAAGAASGAAASGATAAAGGIMASIKSALVSAALNPITLGLVLGLYIGNMPEVQNFVRGVFDAMFGQGASEDLARGFEDTVYNTLGHLLEATGNGQAAQTMYSMASTYVDPNAKPVVTVPQGMVGQPGGAWSVDRGMFPRADAGRADINSTNTPGGELLGGFFNYFMENNKTSPEMIDQMAQEQVDAFAQSMSDAFINSGKGIDMTTFGTDLVTTGKTAIDAGISAKAGELQTSGQNIVAPIAQGVGTKFKTLPTDTGAPEAAMSLTTPFVTTFTSAFSPGGTVTAPFMQFSTAFTTQMQGILATTQVVMPGLQQAITSTMSSLSVVIGKVSDELTSMGNALNGLNGKSIHFSVTSTAGEGSGSSASTPSASVTSGVDATAKTGLDYVPFDGFIAELHKGEKVLTAAEARSYEAAGRLANAAPRMGNGSGGDNSVNTITINEAPSWETIKRDAKRQGYNFDKLK